MPQKSSTDTVLSARTALLSEHYGLCRICLEEAHRNRLITPCRCRGSHAYVHKSCLKHWCDSSRNAFCEICRKEYRRMSKGLKPITEWASPQPLNDSIEAKMDYYAAIVWVMFMIRMGVLFYVQGYDQTMSEITAVLGRGFLRAIYCFTFFFNTWYYTTIGHLIMTEWWYDHQAYIWEFESL